MNNNKDPMDQIITEDLLREAEAIDEETEAAGVESMPHDLKEKLKQRLHEQIEASEKERVYAQLSDEDKKALELGRRMLKESEDAESDGKVVYRRKKRKVFLAVAAVAVLVLAMGITSIGGAERIAEMMKIVFGSREILQVDTDEDNYIVGIDKEEEAYQAIKDVFGVDAVKPTNWPEGTVFIASEIDEELQTAMLIYECKGENINYFICSNHKNSSWGIDVEDRLVDEYYVESMIGELEIKEYESIESGVRSYATKFSYRELEYFLIGVMEQDEFDVLVKKLKFFQ